MGNTSPRQQIADAFINNFDDPNSFTECLFGVPKVKARIPAAYGGSAGAAGFKGRLRIAKRQLRQAVGLPRSSHPLATMKPVIS